MENKTPTPIVSIVLGSYNRLPFLQLTLESIRKEVENLAHEIIVIDGGSNDGTLLYLEKQKDILTIIQHNRDNINGKPIARKPWGYFMNLGFKCAQGKYVCMLSDDCLVIPNAIKNGLTLFEKKLLEGRKVGSMAFFFRNWPEDKKYSVQEIFETVFVNHGLYLNSALKEVGYIDEINYDFYCADTDLCLKIRQAGYECLTSPNSYIEHYSHANTKSRKVNSGKSIKDTETLHRKWQNVFPKNKDFNENTEKEKDFFDETNTVKKFETIFSVNIHSKISSKIYNFIYSIRTKIPYPIKKRIRSNINLIKAIAWRIKGKIAKNIHKIGNKPADQSHHLAILCVKKTVYADMAVANINSLHIINPSHKATIYCDTLCYEYLQKRKNKFDYPENVLIIDSYKIADKSWQHYKIDVHIKAAWNDQIDTDADGLWYDDLVIDKEKVTTLVLAHKISDQKNEILLMEKLFHKPEWVNFNHYVAAFVSIPKKLMTKKIESDLRYFNDTIFNNQLKFLGDETQKEDLRRLSEEFAVNLTLQTNFSAGMITTLKTDDVQGDKKSLQSLYYGAKNRITR